MGRNTIDRRVSQDTRKLLKEHGYKVRNKKLEHKYYMKDAVVNLDYNMLENQYVVRKFVEKKFNLSLRELEILLYLFPKGYFSHRDYKQFPMSYTHRRINSVIDSGLVKIFREGDNQSKHVYTLTKSAKHKVISYYKYLSGELKVPTNPQNNPMVRKDASSHTNKIVNMFKRIRKENKVR